MSIATASIPLTPLTPSGSGRLATSLTAAIPLASIVPAGSGTGGVPPASLFGATDPDSAALIAPAVASPGLFEADPDSAALIAVAVANPSLFETDPDSATLL